MKRGQLVACSEGGIAREIVLTSLEISLLSALLGEICVSECVKRERTDLTVMLLPGRTRIRLRVYAGSKKVDTDLSTDILSKGYNPDELRMILYDGVSTILDSLLGQETKSAYRLRCERNGLIP